ncbi:molybdate ABC transporter substrate-binding protein [Roseobacter sp.]|uniref:molybdate ABC transporter substrate-binding protein n=1 Tax=Roseobacter sp. TaxID=1907202 RepID=UPI00329691AC
MKSPAKTHRFSTRLYRWVVIGMTFVATTAQADTVTVFAAASLRTALDDIAAAFSASTDHEVVISYAGTSVLARQIAQGAPADVVISASTDWMDWLAAQNAIVADSRINIAGNRMVLIGHGAAGAPVAPTATALAERLGQDRIAMALVEAVPAGIYGKHAFEHFGIWAQIAPQVAQTDNVRAALALVAVGAAPFGVVYATDAEADPRVTVLAQFPANSHAAITYPAARVTGHDTPPARAFLHHLQTNATQATLHRHGFRHPADTP